MCARRIWINEDNASFYIGFPADAMSVAGCQALVDAYVAQGAVEGISFCANVSRALFDSQAWEPLYADYDGEAGDDQACLAWLPPDRRSLDRATHGRTWIHHLWLLRDRGVDHLAVWLARCRHHGVQGWLSITVILSRAPGACLLAAARHLAVPALAVPARVPQRPNSPRCPKRCSARWPKAWVEAQTAAAMSVGLPGV